MEIILGFKNNEDTIKRFSIRLTPELLDLAKNKATEKKMTKNLYFNVLIEDDLKKSIQYDSEKKLYKTFGEIQKKYSLKLGGELFKKAQTRAKARNISINMYLILLIEEDLKK